MRCVIGVVLFVVLYFGSCAALREITIARTVANSPTHSRRVGERVAYRTLKKYHALVAVAAGLVALGGCALPTLLTRWSQRAQFGEFADELYRP